jgi:hypothetical protein
MRAGSCASSIAATVLLGILFDGPRFAAHGPEPSVPRTPYEDAAACPFAGCVYREWVANEAVAVLQQRRPGAAVAFHLTKGERVQAISGVVVTLTPGRLGSNCGDGSNQCAETNLEQPQSVWWVQIRNAKGQIGWTDQPEKFGNKDAAG